ncbi:hypothetical protein LCGC14_0878580 [marine sediment metagenome]|uniref:Uncharacterized protein n=1 Tax=marine sediment metagenome TaxID=412755 RepID=A0A0F9PN88_9ZZZZ
MRTTDERLGNIERHLSGNGDPPAGVLFRLSSIEDYRLPAIEGRMASILKWVRFIAGVVVVGVAKLLIFGGG